MSSDRPTMIPPNFVRAGAAPRSLVRALRLPPPLPVLFMPNASTAAAIYLPSPWIELHVRVLSRITVEGHPFGVVRMEALQWLAWLAEHYSVEGCQHLLRTDALPLWPGLDGRRVASRTSPDDAVPEDR